jgi:hypothetical protein
MPFECRLGQRGKLRLRSVAANGETVDKSRQAFACDSVT